MIWVWCFLCNGTGERRTGDGKNVSCVACKGQGGKDVPEWQ
jgi:DnaJ-class molecular chaperone